MVKHEVVLLQELLDYSQHKFKPRGGWYVQALRDCIETLEEGNFNKIKARDKQYELELKKRGKK